MPPKTATTSTKVTATTKATTTKGTPKKSSRKEDFKACIRKNPEFEKYLFSQSYGSQSERPISATTQSLSTFIKEKESSRGRGIVDNMPENSLKVLSVQEALGNHSIILVKSNELPQGWAIFEPNSKKHLPFKIVNSEGKDVTNNYLDVSGKININYGSETENPGYCGMYGITFMTYFRNRERLMSIIKEITGDKNPNWIKIWQNILSYFAKKTGKSKSPEGLNFAAEVQSNIRQHGQTSTQHKKLENVICEMIKNLIIDNNLAFVKPKTIISSSVSLRRSNRSINLARINGISKRNKRSISNKPLKFLTAIREESTSIS